MEKGNQHIYKVNVFWAANPAVANGDTLSRLVKRGKIKSQTRIGLGFHSDWLKDSKVARIFKFEPTVKMTGTQSKDVKSR